MTMYVNVHIYITIYIYTHSQFYSCLFLAMQLVQRERIWSLQDFNVLSGKSDNLVHFAKRGHGACVMDVYPCISMWSELWSEQDANKTLRCLDPRNGMSLTEAWYVARWMVDGGWWWFCVLNDSKFIAWLFWPVFTRPCSASMLRRSFQEHVSYHIFRNLDFSWQAILENHGITIWQIPFRAMGHQDMSHGRETYVRSFLVARRIRANLLWLILSPFRTSLASLWCRRLPRRLWWSYPLHPLRCPSSQHCFWQETTVSQQ